MNAPPPPARRAELDATGPRPQRRRWPLLVIGASAGTAVWSGWVGLGQLVGFGIVHPLPGIWDTVQINTAITLPVGVEAYAMYALSVATGSTPITRTARRFAWTSSVAALLLGMVGQVAYHLMNANHVTAAPWPIVAGVSCLPVLVLGVASVLWHLAGQHPAPAEGAVEDTGTTGVAGALAPSATAVAPGQAAPHEGTAPHLVQPVPATPAPGKPTTPTARRSRSTERAEAMAKVARYRAAHPDWTHAQIAARARVSAKTVSRYLAETTTPTTPEADPTPSTVAAVVEEDAA